MIPANGFKTDSTLLQRPQCHRCPNPALMVVGRMFLCGSCVYKFNQMQQKMVFSAMEKEDG